jgi:hypothetical protein
MADREFPESSTQQIAAVVIAPDGIRALGPLVDVDAHSLRGCAAEDPADWNDVALVWPRYRFHPENTEFVDGLPAREIDLESAIRLLHNAAGWIALDLFQKRFFTGGQYPLLRRRPGSAADKNQQAEPTILPPWWELWQHVAPAELRTKRDTPIIIPDPRRDVLWGPPMTRFFAEAMMAAIGAQHRWIDKDWEGKPCGDYGLTVQIHREWLMAPRADLGSRSPRDCMHGGQDWIGALADGQGFRAHKDEEPVPIPTELSTYETAPMGSHEMIMYFDACRETIAAGWSWLINNRQRIDHPQVVSQLEKVMAESLMDWMQSPLEGTLPPVEVIRCDRVRIPLVDRGGEHIVDCDCPICQMMADGLFGPSFIHFDGHQLELDDEFAFSMCETHEQWEEQQREWRELDARIDADILLRRKDEELVGDEELESVWKNTWQPESQLPDDSRGHLRLAFLVADMVTVLKETDAPQQDVDELNNAFHNYRRADLSGETRCAAEAFKRTLETLGGKHDCLVSRSADLQSRIDELIRVPVGNDGRHD